MKYTTFIFLLLASLAWAQPAINRGSAVSSSSVSPGGGGGAGTVQSVDSQSPDESGNVDLSTVRAPVQSITDLSGGGPYALTLGPAPYPKYRVTISADTTVSVSGSPNAGDGAIIENVVTGAPRVVTYPTAYRNNAASTSTSISVSSPRSDFLLKYTGTEYRWYDQEYGADDKSAIDYAADAGANDTYAITLSPAPTAYTTGTQYRFKANTANTGAATININGLGAKTIKKAAGGITTDLSDNDIRAGQHVLLVYDGTNMQMQSTSGNAASGGGGYYVLTSVTTDTHSPNQNNTYYLGGTMNTLSTNSARGRLTVPVAGTLVRVDLTPYVNGTLATTEALTISVLKNGGSETSLSTTYTMSAVQSTMTKTGLGLSVSADDYLQTKIAMPTTWATAPTTVWWHLQYTIQLP